MLCQICADWIHRDFRLSEPLKTFAVLHFAGELNPPKPVRAIKTAFGNIWLYTWCRTIVNDYDLTLTRNDSKKSVGLSACDAVVEGLKRNGHHTTFEALKQICVGKTHGRVREVAKLWCEAHEVARIAGIIPAHVLDRQWYGV